MLTEMEIETSAYRIRKFRNIAARFISTSRAAKDILDNHEILSYLEPKILFSEKTISNSERLPEGVNLFISIQGCLLPGKATGSKYIVSILLK